MKTKILFLMAVCSSLYSYSQSKTIHQNQTSMKLNAGVVTEKLAESKAFYTQVLGFEVTFENEFYLLLHTPNRGAAISFLLPNHPSQQALFHKPFSGEGMYLTIEVEDVDQLYQEIKSKKVEIKIDLRDEPWGDRHFAIQDPNGIGIDLVTYSPQEAEK
ncbi:VOC family protein [Rapidithrix thailandica]|uniref:VOC family protein n=1 Tax=Rapidithrix thailandica TaxID=413964 RepID=A0AAW9SCC4_9BACT